MKHANTLKTIVGFIQSVLSRWIPALAKHERLEDIYNYLPIDGLYATSGQPSEAQFELVKDAGFTSVINLAPTSKLENSLIEEARILEDLGLKYVHIPVDFKNPTDADFDAFMQALGEDPSKTWVHCAANMRVSAFTYRLRTQIRNESHAEAAADLEKIWEPTGVWTQFLKLTDESKD